jgi:hypothetical protein
VNLTVVAWYTNGRTFNGNLHVRIFTVVIKRLRKELRAQSRYLIAAPLTYGVNLEKRVLGKSFFM